MSSPQPVVADRAAVWSPKTPPVPIIKRQPANFANTSTTPKSTKSVRFIENVLAWPESPRNRTICRFTTPGDLAHPTPPPTPYPDAGDTTTNTPSTSATLTQPFGITRLVEWAPDVNISQARARLSLVEKRLPSGSDPFRDEEARTLSTMGIFEDQSRRGYTGVIYRTLSQRSSSLSSTSAESACGQLFLQPKTLRNVLVEVPKPSPHDRRVLSRIIVSQVRSLHVHFQVVHGALRTDSFVFFDSAGGMPDLKRPYVLDWARSPASRGMFQHPGFRRDSPYMWAYDVWAVLMMLSEIAEWAPMDPLDGGVVGGVASRATMTPTRTPATSPSTPSGANDSTRDAALLKAKRARKELITSDGWKGALTAAVFRFGFAAIDRGFDEVAGTDRWEIKRFWDRMCDMLDSK